MKKLLILDGIDAVYALIQGRLAEEELAEAMFAFGDGAKAQLLAAAGGHPTWLLGNHSVEEVLAAVTAWGKLLAAMRDAQASGRLVWLGKSGTDERRKALRTFLIGQGYSAEHLDSVEYAATPTELAKVIEAANPGLECLHHFAPRLRAPARV